MRISDWSSEVCSSDLRRDLCFGGSNEPLPRSRTRAVGGHARRRDSRSDHQSGVDALVAVRQGAEPQSQRRISQIGKHTSELQSLMRISYAVFCLKKKKKQKKIQYTRHKKINKQTKITKKLPSTNKNAIN